MKLKKDKGTTTSNTVSNDSILKAYEKIKKRYRETLTELAK